MATDRTPRIPPASLVLRPRDFVVVGDMLAAVTSVLHPDGPVVTPRYLREGSTLRKLDPALAAEVVASQHPGWRRRSGLLDADVVLVPLAEIEAVLRPESMATALIAALPGPGVAGRAGRFLRAMIAARVPAERIGVTGSLLAGAANDHSDIDVVCYGRAAFAAARAALASLCAAGELAELTEADWLEAWRRRGEPGTSEAYVRQERSKGTKARIGTTRIDLSLLQDPGEGRPEHPPYRRLGRLALEAVVTDAEGAFDYPARYVVRHPVGEVASYTATYAGQARTGDRIRAWGWLERCGDGSQRLLVGTSREAEGEGIERVS